MWFKLRMTSKFKRKSSQIIKSRNWIRRENSRTKSESFVRLGNSITHNGIASPSITSRLIKSCKSKWEIWWKHAINRTKLSYWSENSFFCCAICFISATLVALALSTISRNISLSFLLLWESNIIRSFKVSFSFWYRSIFFQVLKFSLRVPIIIQVGILLSFGREGFIRLTEFFVYSLDFEAFLVHLLLLKHGFFHGAELPFEEFTLALEFVIVSRTPRFPPFSFGAAWIVAWSRTSFCRILKTFVLIITIDDDNFVWLRGRSRTAGVSYVQGRGDPELENLMDDYVHADRRAVKRYCIN